MILAGRRELHYTSTGERRQADQRSEPDTAFVPLPFSGTDFQEFAPHHRFDAQRELVRPFYDVKMQSGATYDGGWAVWQLGSLLFSKARFNDLVFEHAPHRLKGQDHDLLLVEIYLTGSGRGRAGDLDIEHRAGAIQIIDMSRAFVNVTAGVTTYGVLIPHAAVGYDPSRHPQFLSLSAGTAAGRILVDFLLAQFARLDGITQADAADEAQRFAALVAALAISPARGHVSDAIAQARRLSIERFIEARIDRSGWGVKDICAAFDISRASLYRHFPEDGGVARFIRMRRLARAARELATQPATRGQVSAVAERWGFSDAGHLHRLIKHHYGEPPSALAGSRIRAAAPATHAEVLGSWFHKISVMPNAETSVHGSRFRAHAIQDGK